MAQTLMACLPQLFRTCSKVPGKNLIAADLGYYRVNFFFSSPVRKYREQLLSL